MLSASALIAKLRGGWKGPGRPGHLRTGAGGERAAARYLRSKGYKVLRRNLRTPVGEVDLLCLAPDRRTIVIVEVKTRSAAAGGDRPAVAPELALNRAKRNKLRSIAQDLIRRKRWRGRTVRIDLIAIDVGEDGKREVRHHPNAVMLESGRRRW